MTQTVCDSCGIVLNSVSTIKLGVRGDYMRGGQRPNVPRPSYQAETDSQAWDLCPECLDKLFATLSKRKGRRG